MAVSRFSTTLERTTNGGLIQVFQENRQPATLRTTGPCQNAGLEKTPLTASTSDSATPSSMPCRNLSICSRVQRRRQKKRCTYLKCTNPFCHSWLTIWIRFTLFVSTYLLSWINPFTSKKSSAYESFTNQPKKPLITNLTINLKKLCMNRKIFIRKVCMSSWSTTFVIDYETARCSSRTMTRSSLSAHSCHLFCASERS